MKQTTTKTLYEYWNALRGARTAPDRRDLDPTQFKSALATTFILESEDSTAFNFRLAGSHLCSTYCRELKGRDFASFWDGRDQDAIETLIRAVTEDHAVALVTFTGTNATAAKAAFELLLLPLRHNGRTNTRLLGSMTALDEPYWFGTQPVMCQRITGLKLIWPDEVNPDVAHAFTASVVNESNFPPAATSVATPAEIAGNSARRYHHLSVIDGGRA